MYIAPLNCRQWFSDCNGKRLVVEVHQLAVEGPFLTLNSDMHSDSSILLMLNLGYFSYETGFFDKFAFNNNNSSLFDTSPWS